MSRVAKIISMLFLLAFGLGLTACGTGSNYTGTGQAKVEEQTPPTKEELAAQEKAAQKEQWRSDQQYGDANYSVFTKKFEDGTVAHCVARYTAVSCSFK